MPPFAQEEEGAQDFCNRDDIHKRAHAHVVKLEASLPTRIGKPVQAGDLIRAGPGHRRGLWPRESLPADMNLLGATIRPARQKD